MKNEKYMKFPTITEKIYAKSEALGFQMVSDPLTGSLLRTLAASKPAGMFLELGTGTGVSAAWLLDGMDKDSQLTSVENDVTLASIAKTYLEYDQRIKFKIEDATSVLNQFVGQKFDLIFADTWIGKYSHLEEVLDLLEFGGLYIVDDMLPQPSWPSRDHVNEVNRLISTLNDTEDLVTTKIDWSSGIVIATKVKH